MRDRSLIPQAFPSVGSDDPELVPIVVRTPLDEAVVEPILEAIAAVAWVQLQHAYGAAGDVRGQLAAITVGDDATRASAWWNLWGNIHHQGTIYEATVAAVPILARLAEWDGYPDRTEAIRFLREVAQAEGVVVWRHTDGEEIAYDEPAQASLHETLGEHLSRFCPPLLESWREEPPEVRRALLWLLSAFPDLHQRYASLIREELPPQFEAAWRAMKRGPESQEEVDEICAFEEWVSNAG